MQVSVVIPAYNEEKYLPACLHSLHHQTVAPQEIIVVNNSSTDATERIARELGARVLTEKKQGISYARNTGFSAARAEIIARCDADSVMPKDWIEKLLRHFEDSETIAVSGPGAFYDGAQNNSTETANSGGIVELAFFKLTRLLQGYNTLFGSNMAIRTAVWHSVKAEVCSDNQVFHEDMDLAIHAHRFGEIKYDATLVVGISARRAKTNPYSLFIDYPRRWFLTLFGKHHFS